MRRMWLPVVLASSALLPRAQAGRMSCKEVLAHCYDTCIEQRRGRDNMQQCLVACGVHFKVCEHETARADGGTGTPDAGTATAVIPPSRHPTPPPDPAGPDLSAWEPE